MTNIILCGGSGTRLWPISRILNTDNSKLTNPSKLNNLNIGWKYKIKLREGSLNIYE